MSEMNSSKPYLLRAIYEWIVDNHLTPHLLVDASRPGVIVPRQFVQDGKIVLNINPAAVEGLNLNNLEINFSARFSGAPMDVELPIKSVIALYAKENGQGMMFSIEDEVDSAQGKQPAPVSGRATLKLIK